MTAPLRPTAAPPVATSSLGQRDGADDFFPVFQQAKEVLGQGNFEAAFRLAEKALGLAPRSTLVLALLAKIELYSGRAPEGEAFARRGLEIDPTNARCLRMLGRTLVDQGRFEDAEAAYEKAITHGATDTDRGDVLYDLCVLARRQGRDAEAEAYFEEARKTPATPPRMVLEATNVPYLTHIAKEARRRSDWAAATKHLAGALARAPNDPIVLTELARVYMTQSLGKKAGSEELRAKAHALLEQAMKRAPGDLYVLIARADLARISGRPSEAVELYREYLHRDPTGVQGRAGLARSLLDLDAVAEAKAAYTDVLAVAPNDSRALVGLGDCAARELNPTLAERYYQRALESEPENALALSQLGKLVGQYDLNRGLRFLQESFAIRPSARKIFAAAELCVAHNWDARARPLFERILSGKEWEVTREFEKAHFELGKLELRAGQLDAADAVYARLARARPDLASAWTCRGQIALNRNRLPEAERFYGRAQSIDGENAYALVGLATVAYRKGDLPSAELFIAQLIDKDPENVLAQTFGAEVAAARGLLKSARRRLDVATRLGPEHPRVRHLEPLRAALYRKPALTVAEMNGLLAKLGPVGPLNTEG